MHKVPHLQATGFTNTQFKQIWSIQSSILKIKVPIWMQIVQSHNFCLSHVYEKRTESTEERE